MAAVASIQAPEVGKDVLVVSTTLTVSTLSPDDSDDGESTLPSTITVVSMTVPVLSRYSTSSVGTVSPSGRSHLAVSPGASPCVLGPSGPHHRYGQRRH